MACILSNIPNDCRKNSISTDFRVVQATTTIKDLTCVVMADLSKGLQLRSISCKWLGRLSREVFRVDRFMNP